MPSNKKARTKAEGVACPACKSTHTRKNEEESDFDGLIVYDCLDCDHRFCPIQTPQTS